jgi:hypothetical protein
MILFIALFISCEIPITDIAEPLNVSTLTLAISALERGVVSGPVSIPYNTAIQNYRFWVFNPRRLLDHLRVENPAFDRFEFVANRKIRIALDRPKFGLGPGDTTVICFVEVSLRVHY